MLVRQALVHSLRLVQLVVQVFHLLQRLQVDRLHPLDLVPQLPDRLLLVLRRLIQLDHLPVQLHAGVRLLLVVSLIHDTVLLELLLLLVQLLQVVLKLRNVVLRLLVLQPRVLQVLVLVLQL